METQRCREEGPTRTEAEAGALQLQVERQQGSLAAAGTGGGEAGSSPEAPEGARPCQHLDLGLLAPRTVRGHLCCPKPPSFCHGSPS